LHLYWPLYSTRCHNIDRRTNIMSLAPSFHNPGTKTSTLLICETKFWIHVYYPVCLCGRAFTNEYMWLILLTQKHYCTLIIYLFSQRKESYLFPDSFLAHFLFISFSGVDKDPTQLFGLVAKSILWAISQHAVRGKLQDFIDVDVGLFAGPNLLYMQLHNECFRVQDFPVLSLYQYTCYVNLHSCLLFGWWTLFLHSYIIILFTWARDDYLFITIFNLEDSANGVFRLWGESGCLKQTGEYTMLGVHLVTSGSIFSNSIKIVIQTTSQILVFWNLVHLYQSGSLVAAVWSLLLSGWTITLRILILWLKDGDANTKHRKRKNFIASLVDGDVILTSHEDKAAKI
ncbi:hypothetical protein ACJX0J_022631, partial [Zea mays]